MESLPKAIAQGLDPLIAQITADGVILATLLGVVAKTTKTDASLMQKIATASLADVLENPNVSETSKQAMKKRIEFVFQQAKKISS